MRRKELGRRGESFAVQNLESKGYRIKARNWRTSEGELDIVAEEGDTIVFVEVKARRSNRFGTPEEAITKTKRLHLIKAALAYLDANQIHESNWRFDLITIEWSYEGALIRMEHHLDVIQANPGEFV